MNEQLKLVARLQKKDTILSKVNDRIIAIPDELEALKGGLDVAKNEVEQAKKSLEDEKKILRLLESEVEQLKDHLSKAKQKVPDVKTNKEYTALLAEIESLSEKIKAAEDKELEQMEAIENKKGVIPEKEALLKTEENTFDQMKSEKERELQRVKEEYQKEAEERDQLRLSVESDLLTTYQSLLENKDGVAVCSLEGDICKGCDMEVPPQFAIDVRAGEDVLFCPQCGRILFFQKKASSG
ncbi:MAG: zinc ribbon domain-containing protein [Nitrospinota bacterium]